MEALLIGVSSKRSYFWFNYLNFIFHNLNKYKTILRIMLKTNYLFISIQNITTWVIIVGIQIVSCIRVRFQCSLRVLGSSWGMQQQLRKSFTVTRNKRKNHRQTTCFSTCKLPIFLPCSCRIRGRFSVYLLLLIL